MSNKIGIIVQARCGSTRLPNKILLRLQGQSILEHIIKRLRRVKKADLVIVATTIKVEDLVIAKLCFKLHTFLFCGSVDDVLDRYYQAAKIYDLQNIVRITSDCPLIDPNLVDLMISWYLKQRVDYASNTLLPTFPDGEDIEIMKFSALKKTWQSTTLLSEREHVTPYIYKHPELFSQVNYKNKENLSNKRWTVDETDDYRFVKRIYQGLYRKNPYFGIDEILKFVKTHPEVEAINQHITRNEGYTKSLQNDKKVTLKD